MDLLKMFAISGVGMSAKRSRMSVITGNLATKIEDSRHRTLTDEQRAWALTNFLTDLKEKFSHLLLFLSPQQKCQIFIGLPHFESILKMVTTRRGFQASSRNITVKNTLLERSGLS